MASLNRRHRQADEVVIGDFVIGGEVGKGSFAKVYIAKHKVTGAAVAVKSVEVHRLNNKLKENLYGEINILKTLRHPHIVALHNCLETKTHINLFMEYCELGDLSMFIKKREKLITNPATHDMARKYPCVPNSGLHEVINRHYLKQLASALKFLRLSNLVHRDVKPQNLLLLPSPEYRETHKTARPIMTASNDSLIPVAGLPSLPMLKLADFGFARVLPSTSMAETLCGSPLYMAPEILRYEKYDAKADLWSVGAVLYEMVCGRPPFRAANHVELLRKIEAAEDTIRFTRDHMASSGMKSLIRALLKRAPVERLSFENFFEHEVVTGPIPGLVEDDLAWAERQQARERAAQAPAQESSTPSALPKSSSTPRLTELAMPSAPPQAAPAGPSSPGVGRKHSFRRYTPQQAGVPTADHDIAAAAAAAAAEPMSSSPRSSPRPRYSQSPRNPGMEAEGLGIRRTGSTAQPSTLAATAQHRTPATHAKNYPGQPSSPVQFQDPYQQPHQQPHQQQHQHHQRHYSYPEAPSPTSSLRNELTVNEAGDLVDSKGNTRDTRETNTPERLDKTALDIAFERDYVVVEKKHVEVNAFADEMAANPRMGYYQGSGAPLASPRSGSGGQAMVRRFTQQGHPTSATGAVPASPSRALQVAQGAVARVYDRPSSLSASPGSAASFISKAIHDASYRLLGVKNPGVFIGKGASPPQMYNPFPSYGSSANAPIATGLLTDGRAEGASAAMSGSNTDNRIAQFIEDFATRSDVVYGFAEVKLKQLMPAMPSSEHALGGLPAGHLGEDEDELTLDAVVILSEEALVLYVKALSLLEKSMDIANSWWQGKMRGEVNLVLVRETPIGLRINAAVQWIRARFNEVLEKANLARERLQEAQRRLPEDHPSHPTNHVRDERGESGVFLSAGVSAEKLMYDRAVEMSRAAAIGEISNEDLGGCELSYMTAICMLEAVLDTDDRAVRRRSTGSGTGSGSNTALNEKAVVDDEGEINSEDQKTVESMIGMIRTRLAAVRKKARLISSASKGMQRQDLVRRRSGDVTPRSVPSHAS